MSLKTLHIVGFGSQASAWAQCLQTSGWNIEIYLHKGSRSFEKARSLNFSTQTLDALPAALAQGTDPHWVAMLCPDSAIAPVYAEFMADSPAEIRLVLAHGYVVYSEELQLRSSKHHVCLLAPKAIGPKLLQNYKNSHPEPHSLATAFNASPEDAATLIQIASGMGFAQNALIEASFQQEAIGDLMSEQGLLCGGVFNLLSWTLEAMAQAGIPEGLIREECLTELELIAGMIRERGPGTTFQLISQAAQCGTIAMGERLEKAGFKKEFMEQMQTVQSRKFVQYLNDGEWKSKAQATRADLLKWETKLKR